MPLLIPGRVNFWPVHTFVKAYYQPNAVVHRMNSRTTQFLIYYTSTTCLTDLSIRNPHFIFKKIKLHFRNIKIDFLLALYWGVLLLSLTGCYLHHVSMHHSFHILSNLSASHPLLGTVGPVMVLCPYQLTNLQLLHIYQ